MSLDENAASSSSQLETDEEHGRPGRGGLAAQVIGALLALVPVVWLLDIARTLGFVFYDQQFLAVILGIALALGFVRFPMRSADLGRVPWYDWLAAIAGFLSCVYVASEYQRLSLQLAFLPTDALIVAAIIVVLCLEALRRTVGLPLLLVACAFGLYGLIGHLAPTDIAGRQVAPARLLLYLTFDLNGLLGLPLAVISSILAAFILFGTALSVTNGSGFFTDLALATMGRYRGGAAKISVLSSLLFGSISGSPVSNVVSTGVVTIPLMKRTGYSPEKAGAIEAVASTGGQLMPPVMGAGAFLMAEFLRVPYSQVVIAALFPAILYYLALFIVVDLEAARYDIRSVVDRKRPPALRILVSGWTFLVSFAAVIIGIFSFNLPAGLAAVVGTALLVVLNICFGYQKKRVGIRDLWTMFSETGASLVGIIMIGAAASFVIAVLNVTGLGYALTLLFINLGSGGLLPLLILAAVISIVLGMGMPTVAVYALVGVMIAPSLVELGADPMAAHLFVFYFGILSGVTPPVAVAAFTAANVARAKPFLTCFQSMRFGWSAYLVPFLLVFSPSLMLRGTPIDVAIAVVTALVGILLTNVGVVGYLFTRVPSAERVLFGIAGLMAIMPANIFEGAIYADVAGIAFGAVLIARNWQRNAGARPAVSPKEIAQSE